MQTAAPSKVTPRGSRRARARFRSRVEATGYRGTYDVELFTMGKAAAEAANLLERCDAGMRKLLAAVPV